jgi:hypothetical protein
MKNLTAETRRRGEETSEHLTTEARRHGEGSGDLLIARDRVIGKAAYIFHPERVGANATASRRTPTTRKNGNTASGSFPDTSKGLRRHFNSAWNTICATLREIFDESAYDRFLLRTRSSRSVASYREFTRERDAAMLKKSRCC